MIQAPVVPLQSHGLIPPPVPIVGHIFQALLGLIQLLLLPAQLIPHLVPIKVIGIVHGHRRQSKRLWMQRAGLKSCTDAHMGLGLKLGPWVESGFLG